MAFPTLDHVRTAGSTLNTALILGDTVSPGTATDGSGKSLEQQQAEADGFTVTVVPGSTWDSMTAADFAKYQVVILGDPTCRFTPYAAAVTNETTWEPVVMGSGGNRVLIGTDPTFHNDGPTGTRRGDLLEKGGIGFAGAIRGATGAYIDTSCSYSGSPPGSPVPLMDGLSSKGPGQFTAGGAPCAGSISIVASTGPTSGLHDADLSNWFCSVHAFFDKFPSDYTVLALATDPSVPKTAAAKDVDTGAFVSGSPYILVSGTGISATSHITLTPATATNPVGTSHTVTATVTGPDGTTPLAGIVVSFSVDSGPNAGKTGSGTTNASGQTTFTYTDTGGAGTDTISGTFTDSSGAVEKGTAMKTWSGTTVIASSLALGPASTSDFNDPVTVSATLTDSSGPIAGGSVSIAVGSQSCTATTDATGRAACPITPADPAGAVAETATFAGDSGHTGSTASGTFTITREQTTLTYTGDRAIANGSPAHLAAVLREDGSAPIASRTVSFHLGTTSPQTCSGVTDATGLAQCTIASVFQPVIAGSGVPISATFAGDSFYLPASDGVTAGLLYLTGEAYGVAATTSAGATLNRTPDTGEVATTTAGTTPPGSNCTLVVNNAVDATGLCASVTTSLSPQPESRAHAQVASATIPAGPPPTTTIRATGIDVTSDSTCGAATGATVLHSLDIGPLRNQSTPGPNTVIPLPSGGEVILNEQITSDGGARLTVNGVHVIIPGQADVVLGSASSDIHNCPTVLTLAGARSSDFHDTARVGGRLLTAASTPLVGKTLTVTVGSQSCTAVTDATGTGLCPITPTVAAGTYGETVTFAGDPRNAPAVASGSFTVTLEETSLTYSGDTTFFNGRPAHLAGVLTEDGATSIAGRTLTLSIGSGSSTPVQSCTATTDATGKGACDITSVDQTGPAVPIHGAFAGDAFYRPSSVDASGRLLGTTSITPRAATSDFHDPVTVSATLVDNSNPLVPMPLPGRTLTFSLPSSGGSCAGTTDLTGTATCSLTPTLAAGSYTLTVRFAGDSTEAASSATTTFTVTKEETSLAYTGDTAVVNGSPATLSAMLTEDGTSPISGRPVRLTLGAGTSAQSCTGTTDSSGRASCTVVVSQPGPGPIPITATFAGDSFYKPASAASSAALLTRLTGRAYLVSGGIAGMPIDGLPTQPVLSTFDTGFVSTGSNSTVRSGSCTTPAATPAGSVQAQGYCGTVTTQASPASSAAESKAVDVHLTGLPAGVPDIGLTGVEATSTATCDGLSGGASYAGITIGSIPVTTTAAPNTVLGLPGGATLILNEQIRSADGSTLTVNAAHLIVPGAADVILVSATSDRHDCPSRSPT